MKRFSFSTNLIILAVAILVTLPYVPQGYAASCTSRDMDQLEDEYDDSRDDFDDERDDSNIESDLEDIRREVRRARSGSAVDAAIRRAQGDINDLEEEGDDIHDDFLSLAEKSKFEDCEDEVDDLGDDLRRYIRNSIRDLQDDLDALDDESDDSEREREGRVRAPVWHWGEETSQEYLNTASDSDEDDDEERTAEEISEEIRRLFIRIQELLIELAKVS